VRLVSATKGITPVMTLRRQAALDLLQRNNQDNYTS
jgi:hypothetical protein